MQGFDVESLIQIQCTIMYGCDSCLERCRTLNKVHRNFPFYFIALFLGWEQYIFNMMPAVLETTKSGQQELFQFDKTVFINMDCLPSPGPSLIYILNILGLHAPFPKHTCAYACMHTYTAMLRRQWLRRTTASHPSIFTAIPLIVHMEYSIRIIMIILSSLYKWQALSI